MLVTYRINPVGPKNYGFSVFNFYCDRLTPDFNHEKRV